MHQSPRNLGFGTVTSSSYSTMLTATIRSGRRKTSPSATWLPVRRRWTIGSTPIILSGYYSLGNFMFGEFEDCILSLSTKHLGMFYIHLLQRYVLVDGGSPDLLAEHHARSDGQVHFQHNEDRWVSESNQITMEKKGYIGLFQWPAAPRRPFSISSSIRYQGFPYAWSRAFSKEYWLTFVLEAIYPISELTI